MVNSNTGPLTFWGTNMTGFRGFTIEPGDVWSPRCGSAPRQVVMMLDALSDVPYVRWRYPGMPGTGDVMTAAAFIAWVRRSGATRRYAPLDRELWLATPPVRVRSYVPFTFLPQENQP